MNETTLEERARRWAELEKLNTVSNHALIEDLWQRLANAAAQYERAQRTVQAQAAVIERLRAELDWRQV